MCRFCHAGCAVVVDVEDGRPVAVRGDRENPLYRGFCCVKGQQLAAQWSHPERLLHTMKRRADGSHEPIAVEQALDEIAAKLGALLEEHGSRSVAMYSGTYSNGSPVTNPMSFAWLKAIRSRMAFSANTIDQPGKAVAQALHGAWMAPPQSFDTARTSLLVGCNPLVAMSGGIPHANPGAELGEALARGLELIVVDPRRTETARRAAIHLQPRPGEDAAILAALLHVILREDLHDADFVAAHVQGLGALRAAVAPFTPERVAARADVAAAQLEAAARTFAGAGRGVATAGTGPNMSGHGTLLEYLLLCLNTVCGRWLRAGEKVANPGTLIPAVSAVAQAMPPWRAYGFGEKLRVRGLANTAAGLSTAALPDEILMPGEGRVRALVSVGGNPVAAWPDQLKTIEAMRALDLLVQLDVRMSATARLADYVIAARLPIEMPGMTLSQDYLGLYGVGFGTTVPYAQYTPAVVEPPPGAEVIEDWEFFYGLAQRMGLELTLKPIAFLGPSRGRGTPLDMARKPTTDELFGVLTEGSRVPLDEVKQHPRGAIFPDPEVVVAEGEPGWEGRLDVGNAELMADLAALAATPAPHEAGFPLRLVSRRVMNVLNSVGHDLPELRRTRAYNPAYMHPDDLAELGLTRGDVVELRSPHAAILGVVEADPALRRGLVSMSHAFGDVPERDGEVRRIGSSTGRLTPVDRDYDRYTGQPRMSNIPVEVRLYSGALADAPAPG